MHPTMEGNQMSTSPVHFPEFIRFYERIAQLKPDSLADRVQNSQGDLSNISAEAKKKLVFKQAFIEVLEKIKQ
jgi:hypothetical protein